jgi:hypothetical protein
MRTLRLLLIFACAAVTGAASGGAGVAEREAVDASTVVLPCLPVGTYWNGPLPPEGTPSAPDLAIVAIDTRPKDARVHLDDRFVGRARYLDGSPGYLYLEPGSYRLDLRLEGYETVTVAIEAEPGCRYDLKHRLQKARGEPAGPDDESFGRGKPLERVYAPLAGAGGAAVDAPRGGPDPSLRPDVGRETAGAAAPMTRDATLRLQVRPSHAAVWIDGAFVASGSELAKMEAPLAIASGSHTVTAEAPGHTSDTRTIEVGPGQVMELEIVLAADSAGGSL